MAASGATSGFVVTSGRFTNSAKAFAAGRNVQLVDGSKLLSMMQEHWQPLASDGPFADNDLEVPQSKIAVEPFCPQFGSLMVIRITRRGINAGGEFFG